MTPTETDVPDLLARAATTDARWSRAFGPDVLAAAATIARAIGSPDPRAYLVATGFTRDRVRVAAAAWVRGAPDALADACAAETRADPRSLRGAADLLCAWLALPFPAPRDWVTPRTRVTNVSRRAPRVRRRA